mmetsp:Transcript_13763/g.29565  ORF Transcript_13763/g.29565 Transcript_13763/m.29565 type:complete len:104 (-) Transcript_13763:1010-1321(-)
MNIPKLKKPWRGLKILERYQIETGHSTSAIVKQVVVITNDHVKKYATEKASALCSTGRLRFLSSFEVNENRSVNLLKKLNSLGSLSFQQLLSPPSLELVTIDC